MRSAQKTLAITFALPTESSGLVRKLEDRSIEIRDRLQVIRGRIGEKQVEVLHTGVGAKECQTRLQRLLAREHYDFLISAGFAGGTGGDVEAGDLVVAENFSEPHLVLLAQRALPPETIRILRIFSTS